jgi:hypothetical protein
LFFAGSRVRGCCFAQRYGVDAPGCCTATPCQLMARPATPLIAQAEIVVKRCPNHFDDDAAHRMPPKLRKRCALALPELSWRPPKRHNPRHEGSSAACLAYRVGASPGRLPPSPLRPSRVHLTSAAMSTTVCRIAPLRCMRDKCVIKVRRPA